MSAIVFNRYIIYRQFPDLHNIREVINPDTGNGILVDIEEKIKVGDDYVVESGKGGNYRYKN